MIARRAALAGIALSLALASTSCAPRPAASSSITIEYELDGVAQSVTTHPDGVDCSSSVIGASTVLDEPVALFTFVRGIGDDIGRLSGGIEIDGGIVTVGTDSVVLPELVDGVLELPSTTVSGTFSEDPDAPGDGVPITGTVTAHLECDAAE